MFENGKRREHFFSTLRRRTIVAPGLDRQTKKKVKDKYRFVYSEGIATVYTQHNLAVVINEIICCDFHFKQIAFVYQQKLIENELFPRKGRKGKKHRRSSRCLARWQQIFCFSVFRF